MRRRFLVILAAVALAACGRSDGPLGVVFIDKDGDLFAEGPRLSPAAQHLRAATDAGLVALDANGEVVPALADRWIVTDDGLSFIFRLREGTWPDGTELTGESARRALTRSISALRGTSLALELGPIAEVRTMAKRVIELRLTRPAPSLLQLLAQPELTLRRDKRGAGPMNLSRRADLAVLTMKPPAARGLPEEEDWRRYVRSVELRTRSAAAAVELFQQGEVDVVLGGRVGALPLAPTGPLSRGTVQIDPAVGLFGLQVRRGEGFLATLERREAIAMAIDRPALIAPFNIAGWVPTTRIVAPGLPDDPGYVAERWLGQPLEGLRAQAAARVTAWRAANGGEVQLTLAMGDDPGDRILFNQLAAQLAAIGISLSRVTDPARADMVLIDRVARFGAPAWFLDQFACSLRQGLCEPEADALLAQAYAAPDAGLRARKLAEAEARLMLANVFIPLGSPLRFSLVRSDVTGFAANAWAFHPLPALAEIPR